MRAPKTKRANAANEHPAFSSTTQHLADIKALMGFVCFVDEGYDHDEDAHRYGTPCRCCMANHLRHRLAHYDDAKAAEGGEG